MSALTLAKDILYQGRFGPIDLPTYDIFCSTENQGADLSSSLDRANTRNLETDPSLYSSSEILGIRKAAKFAFKLWGGLDSRAMAAFEEMAFGWGPNNSLPLATHTSEVGMLLSLTGQSSDLVIAGFLYPALLPKGRAEKNEASCSDIVQNIEEIISRKFGQRVLSLIADLHSSKAADRASENSLELDVLRCAIDVSRAHAKLLPLEIGTARLSIYSESGVPKALTDQLQFELKGKLPRQQAQAGLYSAQEICDIRQAFTISSFMLKDLVRSWGPREKLPFQEHAFEVGHLLILAGASRDVVVAGFAHDFLEEYLHQSNPEELRSDIRKVFGKRTLELIEGVTEPSKGTWPNGEPLENWRKRKETVVRQISNGDSDLNTLSCATKISTISAGNKYQWMTGDVAGWTAGDKHENIEFFIKHAESFQTHSVPSVLFEQYELELSRFILSARRRGLTGDLS